ncbi:Uncharacterized protein BM_BM17495 [Brugia malayi]|uniref:Gag protein n=1 Tax=Brugia malayi TaxID=6279 RepID=A0A4E9FC55_BRUMA|nr:Uncharacterized protein BM_BM17495 [Brugia malayi]VIO93638.1 Uncharacterized protein BM_BM17495 [Brugia malayi]
MSASIIVQATPVKANLEGLLDEIQQMDLTPLDQKATVEVLCQQYEARARIIKEKLMRLEKYVGTLENINDKWLEHIQLAPMSQKKKEEKYEQMANDDRVEKFGRVSTIRKLLYNELISTKRNNRDWKTIIEEMERVLKQLEAIGENVEQPTIETIIESKLPNWILNQVMEWQYLDNVSRKNLIKRHPNASIPENSALIAIKQSKQTRGTASAERNQLNQENPNWSTNKKRRPCIFCNNNHWDSKCHIYSTVEQRIDRLKEINVCSNCFKSGHKNSTA